MSQDLFFGKTHYDWSRENPVALPDIIVKTMPPILLPASAKVARLRAIKAAADKGDKKAQKKWAKINKKVAKLHLKAAKGDLKAAKHLSDLTATGLFVTSVGPTALKTALSGSFVGRDELLGSFVGGDSFTRVRGNDKLTEIVTSGGAFVGNDKLTEIITSGCDRLAAACGKDEILGGESLVTKAALAPIRATAAVADAARNVGERIASHVPEAGISMPGHSFIGALATEIMGHDEILGGAFVGEEELALAREGGSGERAALQRRFSSSSGVDASSPSAENERSQLASIKEKAKNGNPEAAKQWAAACARVRKIKESAKAGNKYDQARLARIHAMDLFPDTALLYETLD